MINITLGSIVQWLAHWPLTDEILGSNLSDYKFLTSNSIISSTSSAKIRLASVVDPGFSWEEGANSQIGCANLFFCQNCMKMKEFGPQGGVHPWRPP